MCYVCTLHWPNFDMICDYLKIIVMPQVTMQTRVVSHQCAELQHWSGLSTVTRFDAGNTGNNVRVVTTEAIIML
jgi:hypothetical protein